MNLGDTLFFGEWDMITYAKNGEKILIDLRDVDLMQYKWHLNAGYAVRSHGGEQHSMAREILARKLGRPLLPGQQEEVEHCDLNKLNNHRNNLRLSTRSQNSANKDKQTGTYTSQYKGVAWHKKNKRWCAQIGVNNKMISLGYYKDEKEAARAYNDAALKYHGQFARLNNV
jgi:hypothetical protein